MNGFPHEPRASGVTFTTSMLVVHLVDGRSLSVPLAWFPRLNGASVQEREHWRLIADGIGIHWEDLDEDLSVKGLLMPRGKLSGETRA